MERILREFREWAEEEMIEGEDVYDTIKRFFEDRERFAEEIEDECACCGSHNTYRVTGVYCDDCAYITIL